MDSKDQSKFKELMIRLADMYRVEVSAYQAKAYWGLLKGLTIDELNQAVHDHMADTDQGMYFPKPAHLLRAIYGDSKTRDSEANQAWTALCEAIGSAKSDIGEKTKAAISGSGGMYNLKRMSHSDLSYYKREFISNYTSALREQLPTIGVDVQALIG